MLDEFMHRGKRLTIVSEPYNRSMQDTTATDHMWPWMYSNLS